MKSVHEFSKVFIHRDPVDMRKAINGLSAIVESARMGNLWEPHLFVFSGKRRDTIKVIYFDRSGFCLWMKRLEKEKFPWPKGRLEEILEVTPKQMDWLIQGYDLWKMKPFSQLKYETICG